MKSVDPDDTCVMALTLGCQRFSLTPEEIDTTGTIAGGEKFGQFTRLFSYTADKTRRVTRVTVGGGTPDWRGVTRVHLASGGVDGVRVLAQSTTAPGLNHRAGAGKMVGFPRLRVPSRVLTASATKTYSSKGSNT